MAANWSFCLKSLSALIRPSAAITVIFIRRALIMSFQAGIYCVSS